MIEELKKNGIEVLFLNKQISDTPEDQLLLGVEGLIAEYEKAKILERTRRGKLHKARSGKIVGGIPPFGYDYVKDKGYVINEGEAEIVKLIFNLYIQLGSVRAVARKLTEIGSSREGVWLGVRARSIEYLGMKFTLEQHTTIRLMELSL